MHQKTTLPVRALRLFRLSMHFLHGMLMVATAYPRLSQPAKAVFTQRWSHQLLHILAIKVKISGQILPIYPPNTLIVANHVSWLDIFVLNSATVSRFVAKKELRHWPLAGFLIKNVGTLFIDRSNRRDASRVNQQMADALAQGDCIAVFPESTTSDGTGLLPFKSSLFEAARLARASVQPVSIRFTTPGGHYCAAAAYAGDTTFWQSVCLILSTRAMVVELHYLPAVSPYNVALASRFELSESAREAIHAQLCRKTIESQTH